MTKVYVLILIDESADPGTWRRETVIRVYDSPEAADEAYGKLGEWHLSRVRSGDETMRHARIEEHDVLTQAQPWLAAL